MNIEIFSTGDDLVLITAIEAAQDTILGGRLAPPTPGSDHLDLPELVRLAARRAVVESRNGNGSLGLPPVWSPPRSWPRHVTFAGGDPDLQVHALAHAALAVGASGDPDRAGVLITEAARRLDAMTDARRLDAMTDAARGSITDPRQRVSTLIALARASAASRDPARAAGLVADAEEAARRVDEFHRSDALAEIIPAVVALGDPERAEEIARSDTFRPAALQMLNALVRPLAASGDHRRAEQLARMISDQQDQAAGLATVALAVAATGDLDRAAELSRDAERIVYRSTDAWADTWLMTTEAAAVDVDRAERLAGTITDPHGRARALTAIARAALPDDPDRADLLIARAEQAARTIEDERDREWALDEVAQALRTSPDRPGRGYPSFSSEGVRTLAAIARSAAAAGDLDRVTALLARIDPTDVGAEEFLGTSMAYRHLAAATAAMGEVDRALELLGEDDDDSPAKWQAIGEVARATAVVGSPDRAVRIALAGGQGFVRDVALVEVVRAVAAAGDPDLAEQIARTIDDLDLRTEATVELVAAIGLPGWMV